MINMIILNWDFDVLPVTFDENFMFCSSAELMNYDSCCVFLCILG